MEEMKLSNGFQTISQDELVETEGGSALVVAIAIGCCLVVATGVAVDLSNCYDVAYNEVMANTPPVIKGAAIGGAASKIINM